MANDTCQFNSNASMSPHADPLVEEDTVMATYSSFQSSDQDSDNDDDNDDSNEGDEDDDNDDDNNSEDMLVVDQHLDPEQQMFEFPLKSRLDALAHLDHDDSPTLLCTPPVTTSLATTAHTSIDVALPPSDHVCVLNDQHKRCSGSLVPSISPRPSCHMIRNTPSMTSRTYRKLSATQYPKHHDANHCSSNTQPQLVDDDQLSPLQLPVQAHRKIRQLTRRVSVAAPVQQQHVGPSAFLVPHKRPRSMDEQGERKQQTLSRSVAGHHHGMQAFPFADAQSLSVLRNAPASLMENDSNQKCDHDSRFDEQALLIKLKPSTPHRSPRSASRLTCFASDEGYDDDEDENEHPLESESRFLDMNLKDSESIGHLDQRRIAAAVTIQSAWRGYKTRKQLQANSVLSPGQRAQAYLGHLFVTVHRLQANRLRERLGELEQRLEEETAMRSAFEKTIEELTVLMDEQHKLMRDRIEQEVSMRQLYERRMHEALDQMESLETRLQSETAAHHALENMMKHVLDKLHEMQSTQQQQMRQEAADRAMLERKLNEALATVVAIKRASPPPAATRSAAARPQPIETRPAARSTPRPSNPATSRDPLRRPRATTSRPSSQTAAQMVQAAKPATTTIRTSTTPSAKAQKATLTSTHKAPARPR